MEEVQWTVGRRQDGEDPRRKVPYTPKQRTTDSMTDGQKEGVKLWNLMVDVLKENGLMEDK